MVSPILVEVQGSLPRRGSSATPSQQADSWRTGRVEKLVVGVGTGLRDCGHCVCGQNDGGSVAGSWRGVCSLFLCHPDEHTHQAQGRLTPQTSNSLPAGVSPAKSPDRTPPCCGSVRVWHRARALESICSMATVPRTPPHIVGWTRFDSAVSLSIRDGNPRSSNGRTHG